MRVVEKVPRDQRSIAKWSSNVSPTTTTANLVKGESVAIKLSSLAADSVVKNALVIYWHIVKLRARAIISGAIMHGRFKAESKSTFCCI